ncbi:sulfur carrier protein ThiS adenylyltransferase ThiF [Desulforamulus aquiferis]|uniref:Sulfur carrier protein ThiS adenylyltransferase ThiF n=1 Tax=Desulforamulus aquiferis TaxID=1397668 RepID=A0AAW7ZEE6_9FIRM|nr:sulfur carrier protein ThiS adenylyltransferase ThiF [Desulforamulus aquiferis]MDO7788093.1 sulfur carrier protein ThiS adenylyltransferase ThiF [Desulforamulus aquiferis]
MGQLEIALTKFFGEEGLALIQSKRIGIAGAGGLGSNCAQMLVRCGFRKLTLVDFDKIEMSNLNRQFFFMSQVGQSKVEALKKNLLDINPDLEIKLFENKIEPANVAQFFIDCDAVIEALDSPVYKRLVVETYLGGGKLVVAASGLAGWGQRDQIKTHRIKDDFFVVGDLVTEVDENSPPVAPGVVLAAAKQADVVLSYFLGKRTKGCD